MRPSDFNIQQIIEDLQGTCDTLQDAISYRYPDMDEMELTEEDHNQIENQIFLCTECNWWCEISEESEFSEEGERKCTDHDEE